MYDHVLRRPKQILFQPVAKRFPLSPNQLTLIGLIAGLLSALFCAFGLFQWALATWVINRVVDGLDGEVARAQGRQSDLGGYYDILADLLVYAFLPLGIAVHFGHQTVWFALGFMLSAFYLNVGSWMYLSSLLEKRGQGAQQQGELTSISMPRGLVEGAETVLFFTLFVLFPHRAALLFGLFGTLTFVTAGLRVKWSAHVLR